MSESVIVVSRFRIEFGKDVIKTNTISFNKIPINKKIFLLYLITKF